VGVEIEATMQFLWSARNTRYQHGSLTSCFALHVFLHGYNSLNVYTYYVCREHRKKEKTSFSDTVLIKKNKFKDPEKERDTKKLDPGRV
jgi:hypothetical protein